jgi:hypothetical protein
MEIKTMIVREYLESLKESEELDYIFPLLLESQGFIILSNPKESKGLPQYGKDVIAVGKDFEDGVLKRFYFELKGGSDRHITTQTYIKPDGIRDSLIEAIDKRVEFFNKKHEKLPLKIVLVHNGGIQDNVKATLAGFVKREFKKKKGFEFDRWGISELTKYFSEKFFGEFLLANKEATKYFNKTLVNLDVEEKVSNHFSKLLDTLFANVQRKEYKQKLPRKWKMMFESLRLIAFIIYTESKGEYNNLDIAKRYTTYLFIRLWHWVLKNKLETDNEIVKYVVKVFHFYMFVLHEYFGRTLSFALEKDGLFSEMGGRYEQVGYTLRTFEYLKYFCYLWRLFPQQKSHKVLIDILMANSVASRPLLDIHSIPIIDILTTFIDAEDKESAKNYLSAVLSYIKIGKEKYGRLPDANNNEQNVIRLVVTREKPIYYSDSTSLLLAVLMEFTVILDMPDKYYEMRDFILKYKIDLGVFVPHHGMNSTSKHLIRDNENDLEEQLFSNYFFDEGYQHNMSLLKDMDKELTYEEFREKILALKDEFIYEYRSDQFLRDLAHIYFRTPYFPDKWRRLL